MDISKIEKYKAEMLEMHKKAKENALSTSAYLSNAESNDETKNEITDGSVGELIVMVTTIRSLYPLENARVTVFEGDNENRKNIKVKYTNQSGKTEPFILSTPNKSLSMTENPDGRPYALYNIEVKAEGYIDSIYLNVPVFSGVTSLQRANMILLETGSDDKTPVIYNELQQYTLGEQ